MVTGILSITLRVPNSRSLKEKRNAVKSILQKVRDQFNVSIADISENGGWRSWLAGLGLEALENEYLANAARQHKRFDWNPGWMERREICDWLTGKLNEATPYLEPWAPGESPEQLIAEALGES